MVQENAFRVRKHPMNSSDCDLRLGSCLANCLALSVGNIRDIFGDRERGDFDAVVARFSSETDGVFDLPSLEDFVANGEIHRPRLKKPTANRKAEFGGLRTASPYPLCRG